MTVAEHRAGKAISFPPFLFDLRAGRLVRGGKPIDLRPKVVAVLCYLLERPGALVSNEELFRAIWNGVAVSENVLTKAVSELRAALEDDPRRPRFIETVHRRGFRFIGPVQPADTEDRDREVEGAAPSTLDAQHPPSLFFGRATELRRLEAAFRAACLGERQLLFITGELGIGKTALVEKFLRSDLVRMKGDVRVAKGDSVEQTGPREAYLPVLAALGRLARLMTREDFVPGLQRCAPCWLAQMPWLLDPAEAMALRRSLGEIRPERMLRELAVYLEEITASAPLILVLEDLHWCDPSTVDFLVMLAQRPEPAKLLILGTYRPAEASVRDHPLVRAKQRLRLRRQCSEIALPYLSRAEVEGYLEQRFPAARFPEGLATVIHRSTDGNPLFVAGVVDELIRRGWLVDTAPGWALTVPLQTLQVEAPDSLRDVIHSQFRILSPAVQSLLEAAAVAGVEFTAEEVVASLGSERDAVEAACEHLVREQRFLRRAGIAEGPDEHVVRRYAFIHALYQRIVYAEIPQARRRHLHQRIGESLERTPGEGAERIAAKLAHHFQQSRDYDRAITHLAAAARTAEQRFAAREALASLEAALALLPHLKDAEERRQREIQLRLPLGSALNLTYGYASDLVRVNCERTVTLCEQAGSPSEVFEALYVCWYSRALRAEEENAFDTARRLVELAGRLDGAAFRMLAASALGRTAVYAGDHRKARDTLARCLAAYESEPIEFGPATYGVHPAVAARDHYAYALHFLGHSDSARDECRKALSFAESTDSPFTLTAATLHAALLHMFCRDRDEALRFSDRALALATEHGFPLWLSEAMAVRGWARIGSGQATAAIEQIREAIALHTAGGTKLAKSMMLGLLAEACLRAARLKEGLTAVEEGLDLAQASLDRFYLPELWRLKGELLIARDKVASAGRRARERRRKIPPSAIGSSEPEACFGRALETARAQHAKALELRAAMSLGSLWESRGKTTEARRLLEPLYASFTEGLDTPGLREAKTLLRAWERPEKAAALSS
jgi:DNA-binding winged helix-turn-helix (wHTH) protein/tetratricopeptide (TPR) repeat protein